MKITEKEIEKLADEYATEQNSAYTNDYYSFIAGFEKAMELLNPKPTLIICPLCRGENQYIKTTDGYKCAYTDCNHEWIH